MQRRLGYIENEIGIKTVDAAHYGVFICLGVIGM
jgi:hypothetical protein